jgi:carboxypeptidase Taq
MGAIGYFPTYALGNLYSAQLADAMRRDLGDLAALIERGEFASMLAWLRAKVHVHGRVYTAAELCRRATGSRLDPAVYVRSLEEKFAPIYGI